MSAYAPVGDTRIAAGSTRSVTTPLAQVRATLIPVLRQLHFTLTLEQLSSLEAERGSKLGGFTLAAARVPVFLRVDLGPDEEMTAVTVRLEDRWAVPVGRNWGAVKAYDEVFVETLTALDRALTRLDPAAAEAFEPWWRTGVATDAAAFQNAGGAVARAEGVASRQLNKVLDGPQQRSAIAEAGVAGGFSFVATDQVADVEIEQVEGMLTAGQLIAAKPGGLPKPLVAQVQSLIVMLEGQLEALRGRAAAGGVWMNIDKAHVPVVTFLHQQARLRESLPLRLLLVCTTCRLEKIVNPDFVKMRERSRRMKVLSGSVGLVFGGRHVSPYVLLGRLVNLKKSDPDFVCARCQGLEADQTVVTFCSNCGDRRTETVLRICPNCNFDFRTALPTDKIWREIEVGPPVPAPVATLELAAAPVPLAVASPATVAPGWYPDTFGRFEFRAWDGSAWTDQVSRGGAVFQDPPI